MVKSKKFSIWSNEWLQFHIPAIKPTSIQMYLTKVKYLNQSFGEMNITQITPIQIQEFLNKLANVEGLSSSTIKKYRITLNQIFKYAMFNNVMDKNPASVTSLPKTVEPQTRRSLNDTEIRKVIEYSNKNKTFGLYPLTLLYTGLRRSECVALRWEDIDFKNNYISINKAVNYIKSKPVLNYELKNGDRERIIPLITALKKVLVCYRKDSGWIFEENEKLLTESCLERNWRKFKSETMLDITQHMLRHTYATMLYNAKVDVKTAQKFLGHRNISVTLDIYTHLENKHFKKQAKDLDKYINLTYCKNQKNA